jgi:hypothetical protein
VAARHVVYIFSSLGVNWVCVGFRTFYLPDVLQIGVSEYAPKGLRVVQPF